MAKGYTISSASTLTPQISSISLAKAYFFILKNNVIGNTVDVEIEGNGVVATLAPGEEFEFKNGSPDYPFRDDVQLRIGFFSGNSSVSITIFRAYDYE